MPEVCVTTFGKDAKCQSESTCKGVVRKEKAYCRNSNQVCCAQNLCAKALGSSAKCIGEEKTCEGRVESNLCPSKQRCCLPPTDYPPVGKIKSVNNVVSGWACDKVKKNRAEKKKKSFFLKNFFFLIYFRIHQEKLLMCIFILTNRPALALARR